MKSATLIEWPIDDDATKQLDTASAAIVRKLTDLQAAVVKGGGWIVTAIIIACAIFYFARN
jgi:predicted nucleic acid-binding Zn ribbon protein